jgi:hypothetical protein
MNGRLGEGVAVDEVPAEPKTPRRRPQDHIAGESVSFSCAAGQARRLCGQISARSRPETAASTAGRPESPRDRRPVSQ